MFARRTEWPLEPNALTREIARRRERGLAIVDLTESNPTRCGFRYDSGAILRALAQPAALLYEPEPQGPVVARRAVSAYYAERGVHVEPGQIFLTASTSDAYSHLFRLLADSRDAVLVPQPSYPLFDFLAGLSDLEIVPYPLVYDSGWRIDLDELAVQLGRGERTSHPARALVVVHPNNPTGSYVRADERRALFELCRCHHLALIADEVFSDYAFGAEAASADRAPTHAGLDASLTFTLSGLSKVSALPQMKLAWIVVSGPAAERRAAIDRLEIVADTYLSVSAPVAAALPELIETRRAIQPQIVDRLQRNLAELDRRLISCGGRARRLQIEGGWYAVVQLAPEGGTPLDDDFFAVGLARDDGVVVHPGHFYGFATSGYVVLSLLPPPEIFAGGIEKLLARVSR
ncbi:MAG TPA: pyridoxal phosphate-dependent aminotransferase [Terriglobia bacterium]|nr:pyridoxal phosphate-dependent aminotransferase [Terriglobia bacterium]